MNLIAQENQTIDCLLVNIKPKDIPQDWRFRGEKLFESRAWVKRHIKGEVNRTTGRGKERESALTAAPTPYATFPTAAAVLVACL